MLEGVAPNVPLTALSRGSLPFVLLMFLAIVLIAVFPHIALWLPDADRWGFAEQNVASDAMKPGLDCSSCSGWPSRNLRHCGAGACQDERFAKEVHTRHVVMLHQLQMAE